MKDSKTYQKNLAKFWKPTKYKGKFEKIAYPDPVDAVVYASLREIFNEATTAKALKKIMAHFVDYNDLRVSRPEEILDVLGGYTPENTALAETLTTVLNSIFDKNDCLSLAELAPEGKRKIEEELKKFAGMTNFIISYVMMVCFDAHCIGINKTIAEFLIANEIVPNDEPIDKMQGFLERQIPAVQGYSFFFALLEEAESSSKPVKNKTK